MPEWGLPEEMRTAKPWRLPREVLEPGKIITDPIHGDVYLTRLEQAIVDSPPMQRLRRVRQLGMTHLVYPAATHNRFSHSLGALRVVQDLLDVSLNQRVGRHGRPDLFEQWREKLGIGVVGSGGGGDGFEPLRTYFKWVGEAIVLARLGALLHDLCHVPFGHSVEDDLLILEPHDENADRFRRLWGQVAEQKVPPGKLRVGDLIKGRLLRELRPLILSKERRRTKQEALEYPFVEDLVGNTICADLIDYLQRDHVFTGLPISLGHRYMTGFYVTPDREGQLFPRRMALNIHRSGRERVDIVSELLKHLRYRYELQERVLSHHAKLAADAMVGKVLELVRDEFWVEEAAEVLGPGGPVNEGPSVGLRELKDRVSAHDKGGPAAIDAAVRDRLEELFLERGDDGLLEYLRDFNADRPPSGRRHGVAVLARDLIERRLFKRAANIRGAAAAQELYDRFKDPETRRDLEQDAAAFAGLSDGWKVVLWLPSPKMRLKQAEVLVDHGEGIAQLVDYSPRGREIYDDHRALWSLWVFVHADVTSRELKWVLARLSKRMNVLWSDFEHELGSAPERAPQRLAAVEVSDHDEVDEEVEELLALDAAQASRGAYESADSLRSHFRRLKQERDRRARRAPKSGG